MNYRWRVKHFIALHALIQISNKQGTVFLMCCKCFKALFVTYFYKGRARAEVIVAPIIHSWSSLWQLLCRLNPHYLGSGNKLLKPLWWWWGGGFLTSLFPPFLFSFFKQAPVWVSEKKMRQSTPVGTSSSSEEKKCGTLLQRGFAEGLDFSALWNDEVFLFSEQEKEKHQSQPRGSL